MGREMTYGLVGPKVSEAIEGSSRRMGPAGVGGDFHWPEPAEGPRLSWPPASVFYSTGRVALLRAIENWRGVGHLGTLHLPGYFCPAVTDSLREAGIRIRLYEDNPAEPAPDWSTIACREGDVVLAVNYFGVREGHGWRRWHQAQRRVALIEDHTHDPFSPWARESGADYAIASIRKLYPIPDGGVLWSPAGHGESREPFRRVTLAATLKYAAMKLQAHCVRHPSSYPYLKWSYRSFQIYGERCYYGVRTQGMTNWSREIVGQGVPQAWRDRRRENVAFFLNQEPVPGVAPLFCHWPAGACPFQVVLLFQSQAVRDHVRRELISRRIYCPIHWAQGPDAPASARGLGSRILTIPADQRYGPEDMRRISGILRSVVMESSRTAY